MPETGLLPFVGPFSRFGLTFFIGMKTYLKANFTLRSNNTYKPTTK